MKLSTKGRYGLRALIDLAIHSQKAPVSLNSISQRQYISERYLEQLMAKLKKEGLVKSVRGAGGGYLLGRDPKEISVGDVLRALEGDLSLVDCAAYQEAGSCRISESCITKYVWSQINDSINRTVNGITLDTLMEQSANGEVKEKENE